MWMTSPMIPNPIPGAWLPLAGRRSRVGNDPNSTPIIVRGDGLQVCLPLPKEVGDRKFSIPLRSHKLYLCLWESSVCSTQ